MLGCTCAWSLKSVVLADFCLSLSAFLQNLRCDLPCVCQYSEFALLGLLFPFLPQRRAGSGLSGASQLFHYKLSEAKPSKTIPALTGGAVCGTYRIMELHFHTTTGVSQSRQENCPFLL